MSDPVSACCGAPVTVAGRTTRYYVCTGCGRPCDAAAVAGGTAEAVG